MQDRILRMFGTGLLFLLAAVGVYSLAAPAGAAAQGAGGPGNVVVLCSSCGFEGLPQESNLILLDGRTGEVWAYSDAAIGGKAKPIYMGTLSALGQPFVKRK